MDYAALEKFLTHPPWMEVVCRLSASSLTSWSSLNNSSLRTLRFITWSYKMHIMINLHRSWTQKAHISIKPLHLNVLYNYFLSLKYQEWHTIMQYQNYEATSATSWWFVGVYFIPYVVTRPLVYTTRMHELWVILLSSGQRVLVPDWAMY